ncbi:MAG: hypothetical protein AB8B74_05410 [Crocinitomicaceae bacterium]
MKFQLISLILIVGILISCKTGDEDVSLSATGSDYKVLVEVTDDYAMMLPNYFVEMTDINPKAVLQYGFISNTDSVNKHFEDEFFVTILALKKSDLGLTLADSGVVTIDKVNQKTTINLSLILEDFKVIREKPVTELINGIVTLRNEFSGKLGQYKVFYKMAIYETETYFYQLLTWCMQKHADKHSNEMDDMIHSFENV